FLTTRRQTGDRQQNGGRQSRTGAHYSIRNDVPAATIEPFTICRVCVALAVLLAELHVHPFPDFTVTRNSSVRVWVTPGGFHRLGMSTMVTVKFPPAGQGTTRLFHGLNVTLVGKSANISVQVFAVMAGV